MIKSLIEIYSKLVEILKIACKRCGKKKKEKSKSSFLSFLHEKRDFFQFPFPHVKREEIFFDFSSRMWEGKRFSSHFPSQRLPWNRNRRDFKTASK